MNYQTFQKRYTFKFVAEQLCPWGALFHKVLNPTQTWQAYCLGDGFGKMTPAQLEQINGGYDWSHVRDSSEEAIEMMADFITKEGKWALSVKENALQVWNNLDKIGLSAEEYLSK